jgi:hypothetical protein
MKTEIITLTPNMAKKLLETNKENNRPLKNANISTLKADIIAGRWKLNGESIKISENGKLIDGQHRCLAVISANIPIQTLIVYEVEESSFDTIDLGTIRTVSDLLAINGQKNTNIAAAIVTKYLMYNKIISDSRSIKSYFIPKSEPIKFYYENENLVKEVTCHVSKYYSKLRLYTKAEIGGTILYLHITKKHSLNTIISFFNQLFFYENIENDMIIQLRERLIKDGLCSRKMTNNNKYSLLIKTWNFYVTKKSTKLLKYDEAQEGKIEFL